MHGKNVPAQPGCELHAVAGDDHVGTASALLYRDAPIEEQADILTLPEQQAGADGPDERIMQIESRRLTHHPVAGQHKWLEVFTDIPLEPAPDAKSASPVPSPLLRDAVGILSLM